jgi:nucleoside 2-deoxyribosyltransferase
MKIYVAHSRSFDFQQELYEPLKSSSLAKEHTFVFPHSESDEPFNSKQLFQEGCDLVLAEVSYPATGLGIELGWADFLKIPIACIYKKDVKVSGSLKVVSNKFFKYSDSQDLVAQVEKVVQ